MGEYGRDWVTSARGDTNDLFATPLIATGVPGRPTQINGELDAGPPYAAPALAGLTSTFIAWQQTPGAGGGAEIVVRYAQDGVSLSPEVVLSQPASGSTDAADGLAAAGDVQGNAAVAWLQGVPGGPALYVDQLYQSPGGISATSSFAYARTRTPEVSWRAANELWGPLTYTVSVDGVTAGQTQDTHFTLPQPLGDGTHTWQVTATNAAGRTSQMRPATLQVDATPPVVTLHVSGVQQVGAYLHVSVSATDAPPGEASAAASGLIAGTLDLGDGSTFATGPNGGKYHAYRAPGVYRITATVRDRAGNATVAATAVVIKPKPKPKPKPKRRTKPKPGRGRR
jgi:hypothetical protein